MDSLIRVSKIANLRSNYDLQSAPDVKCTVSGFHGVTQHILDSLAHTMCVHLMTSMSRRFQADIEEHAQTCLNKL
jgi:hypothetical protein